MEPVKPVKKKRINHKEYHRELVRQYRLSRRSRPTSWYRNSTSKNVRHKVARNTKFSLRLVRGRGRGRRYFWLRRRYKSVSYLRSALVIVARNRAIRHAAKHFFRYRRMLRYMFSRRNQKSRRASSASFLIRKYRYPGSKIWQRRLRYYGKRFMALTLQRYSSAHIVNMTTGLRPRLKPLIPGILQEQKRVLAEFFDSFDQQHRFTRKHKMYKPESRRVFKRLHTIFFDQILSGQQKIIAQGEKASRIVPFFKKTPVVSRIFRKRLVNWAGYQLNRLALKKKNFFAHIWSPEIHRKRLNYFIRHKRFRMVGYRTRGFRHPNRFFRIVRWRIRRRPRIRRFIKRRHRLSKYSLLFMSKKRRRRRLGVPFSRAWSNIVSRRLPVNRLRDLNYIDRFRDVGAGKSTSGRFFAHSLLLFGLRQQWLVSRRFSRYLKQLVRRRRALIRTARHLRRRSWLSLMRTLPAGLARFGRVALARHVVPRGIRRQRKALFVQPYKHFDFNRISTPVRRLVRKIARSRSVSLTRGHRPIKRIARHYKAIVKAVSILSKRRQSLFFAKRKDWVVSRRYFLWQQALLRVTCTPTNVFVLARHRHRTEIMSAGMFADFRPGKKRKRTQMTGLHLGYMLAEQLGQSYMSTMYYNLSIRGRNAARKGAVSGFNRRGNIVVTVVRDLTPIAHNGTKPRKKRRL